jgi:serine/threonine-protein kinase
MMVRDFGSLNGTWLNGENIGQRNADVSAEEGRKQTYKLFPLKSGDRLGVGAEDKQGGGRICEIELEVVFPQYCADCLCEIEKPEYFDTNHQPVCVNCYEKKEERRRKEEGVKLAEEKAAKERLEAERRVRELEKKEREAKEQAERERLEKERREAEKQAVAAAEKEKQEAIRLAKEKAIQEKEEARKAAEREKRNNRKCQVCGATLSGGPNEPNICLSCRKNHPEKVLQFFIRQALKGNKDVQDIAGYRNIELLGKGGMGAVWLVEEEKTGKQMALKLMLQGAAADKESKDLFLREAYLSGQLDHKNVVRQYKCGQSGDAYFILMELCRGGSVDELIKKKGGKLDIDLATHIILQVLEGLHYTHNAQVVATLKNGELLEAKGVIHRDFKPANIFLTDDSSHPVAKVADFGLAKTFDTAGLSGNTRDGVFGGTIVFMPRQQIINFRYSKPDVDVWAAAASYYNMLTGYYPKDFSRGDAVSIVLNTSAVPIRLRNSQIPQRLAEVIDAALIDNPKIGIQTALELKSRIETAL